MHAHTRLFPPAHFLAAAARGVGTVGRWTHAVLGAAEDVAPDSALTLAELFAGATPRAIGSTPALRAELAGRGADEILATDFFGSVYRFEDVGDEPFDLAL